MSTHTSTPDVCPSHDTLSALVRGELRVDAARQAAAHLAACPACAERFNHLLGTRDTRQRQTTVDSTPAVPAGSREPATVSLPGPVACPAPPRKAAPRPGDRPPPSRIGQYRVVERLGRGGMGVVYRAWHPKLRKWVAVKFLAVNGDAARAVARFEREMALVARLHHPNIVRATDAGEADGYHYLVMDLVEGLDLGQLLRRRGPLPVAEACAILRQAALALAHAHAHGLVHRDLKPSNLMLSNQGEVKVLDLGLALLRDEAADDGLTPTGQVMGTADYMAPEQWQASHEVDIRADLYSLGCTLYTLLTDRPPFGPPRYATPLAKMAAHATAPVPRVADHRPDVPAAVCDLLGRLLAKDPRDRPADPAELARLLAPAAEGADLVGLVGSLDLPTVPAAPDDRAESAADEPTQDTPVPTLDTPPPAAPVRAVPWRRGPVAGVVGGVVGVVALAVAVGLLTRPGDPPAGPPGPVEPPPPRVYQAGAWTDVLDRPPTELVWWSPAGDSVKPYDPAARALSVQSFAPALLSLGRTDAGRYQFRVGIQQTLWTGGCGFYIGGRTEDGAVKAQLFHLRANLGAGGQFALCRSPCTVLLRPGHRPHCTIPLGKIHGLAAPAGREYHLEVTVGPNGVEAVKWDGQACGRLLGPEVSRDYAAADHRGEFGVYCGSSAVVVRTAQFMLLEEAHADQLPGR